MGTLTKWIVSEGKQDDEDLEAKSQGEQILKEAVLPGEPKTKRKHRSCLKSLKNSHLEEGIMEGMFLKSLLYVREQPRTLVLCCFKGWCV